MKYYCIGIKGTGMSTLAQMLYDMGNDVSGYDDAKDYKFTQKGLEERGIKIFYDGNHKIDKDTIKSMTDEITSFLKGNSSFIKEKITKDKNDSYEREALV